MVSLRFLLLIVALVLLIVRAIVLLSSYAITCNIDCAQLLKYSKKQGLAASFTSLSQYWIVIK